MPLKIYYLDDETELCEIFSEFFSSAETIITTFTDPELAIKAIKDHPPDLFFIDFRLSGTNGDKVAQSIANPAIPMFLISGELFPVTVYQFTRVISKPYKDDDILNLLASYRTTQSL